MHTPFSQNLTHRHIEVSPSTNTELIAALKSGEVDASLPYLLTASTQTAGRGQHNRTWQSPKGNVYLSLYHPLNIPLSGLLSLVVGCHLTRLPIIQKINRVHHQSNLPEIGVKWANDVGFYESKTNATTDTDSNNRLIFNKLAGILIEPVTIQNRIVGVVVGVGLNVNNAPTLDKITQEGMDYQAVSLSQILSKNGDRDTINSAINNTLTPDELYFPVSATLLRAIKQYTLFTIDPYSIHQFMNDYAAVNVLTGHKLKIHQQGSIIKGVASGINPNGSLRLTDTTQNNKVIDIYTGAISVCAS